MTQSAVSHTLSRLRDIFHDPLFVSMGRGMAPTVRALELSEPLLSAIEALGSLVRPVEAFDPGRFEGAFEIATTDYIGFILLPLLIKRLSMIAPRLELIIKPLTPQEDLIRLKNDEIDLVLWNEKTAPPNFYVRNLFSDRLKSIVRIGHPDINGSLSLEQFRAGKHLCVSSNHGAVKEAVDRIFQCGCTISLSVPHFLLAHILVSQSDLIGLIAELTARRIAREVPLQVLEPPIEMPEFTVSQVWHERQHSEPVHRWLRSEIARVAEDIREEQEQLTK